jgi:cob(I)alamin adenosyltransferase
MKIYTRTGDEGDTGLLGPLRVPKDHIRVAAYGEIDELNAWIGSLRRLIQDPSVGSMLESIQSLLFEAGAELARTAEAGPAPSPVNDADVAALEAGIDLLEAGMPHLERFILPGGSEASCAAHIARCVCRRAERSVVRLLRAEPVETAVLRYLNRLSDFLFVLARWANREAGLVDVPWVPRLRDSG